MTTARRFAMTTQQQQRRMEPRPSTRCGTGDDLAERIRGQVERRAPGRIRDLEVDTIGGRVVLRGRSRTFYVKQLAQQAVLDLGPSLLDNRIVVG
jgi:hypothetical protein